MYYVVPPTEKQSNQKAPSLVQNPMKEVVQTVAIHPSLPTNLFSSGSFNNSVIQIQVGEPIVAQLFAAETLVIQKLFLKNWKILTWMSFSKTVKQEVTKAGSH